MTTNLPNLTAYPAFARAGADLSRRLDEAVSELRRHVTSQAPGEPSEAARARADYERTRARKKLEARASGEAKSAADADSVAEASDEVYAARLAWLTVEGTVDALRKEIDALRARLSWGQSLLSAEKASDQQHALSNGYHP